MSLNGFVLSKANHSVKLFGWILQNFIHLFRKKSCFTQQYIDIPPQVIKQVPISISNCLLNNSLNKQVFDMPKGEYEKDLRESGYKNISLIYTDKKDMKQKRNCSDNIIWSNPLFSESVSTNVGKRFLNMIDEHFPKSKKLHTVFNITAVKVSYS